MNHPKQNEWLLYLDGEASPEDVKRLLEHLGQCPMCAAEVAGWKRSVQKLQRLPCPAAGQGRPERRREPLRVSSFVKWGLAAAIVLCMGFAFGRLSALRAGSLTQTIAAQVREDLRRELRADLLAALDPEREVKDGFQKQLRLNVESALAKTNARLYRHAMEVMQQQRREDQQGMLTLIKDVRDQQMSDCLALRRDLETAVATADSDLRQDSRRISQLADTLLTVQK
jgi:anti-sigma factor RsiW